MKRKVNRIRAGGAKGAFTLVELLVVIGIIALLVGILVPAVSNAILIARVTKSKVRIRELSDGIEAFKMDSKNDGLFPGQEDPSEMGNNASAFLTDTLRDADYVSFKDDDILDNRTPDKSDDTISDQFTGEQKAILYYPSRVGVEDLDQYVEDDNSLITGPTGEDVTWHNENEAVKNGAEDATFTNYIKNRSVEGNDSESPYNSGRFLLIGAGKDRIYGTLDDLTNWK